MKKKIFLFCSLLLLQATLSVRSSKREMIGDRPFIFDNYDIIQKSFQWNQDDYESEFDTDENAKKIYAFVNLLEIWILYGDELKEFSEVFVAFLKNFFGVRLIKNQFNNQRKKQLFIDTLIEKLVLFYETVSSDLKYLCDMQIQYLLSFKYELLEKIGTKELYALINTSYFYEQLIVIDQDEGGVKETLSDDRFNSLLAESAEIGLLQNGYMYNLFEEFCMDILNNNKTFKTLQLIKDILLKKIILNNQDNSVDIFLKAFYKNKKKFHCFRNFDEDDFVMWLLNKKNIQESIIKVLNEDSLFLLFLIRLLDASIEKDIHNNYYGYLKEEEKRILSYSGAYADSLLGMIFNVCDIDKNIDWRNQPLIVINQKRVQQIISNLKNISRIRCD
jgi:hypothetical protein